MPENLALDKLTYQSSDNYADRAKSSAAVDGNRDANFFHGSCTHTRYDYEAWWAVDLEGWYSVARVGIQNRDHNSK